jgi:UDP-N-acetylmuramate dehydrogenase
LKISENISLAPFTTLGIGGPAQWLAEAETEEDVAEAVFWAREHELQLFVLGGGSNLLVSDAGFPGLVLRVALKGILRDGESFSCNAGEDWDRFVSLAVDQGFAGIECLAGIPGTVGGTPVQNVGAYGQEVESVIERVHVFDVRRQQFTQLMKSECGFSYRHSRFNTVDRGRFIVTRVDYKLRRNEPPQITYADLKTYFEGGSAAPSLAELADAVREIRKGKGMLLVEGDPDCRSAGSFFKNPEVTLELADRVRESAVGAHVPLRTYPAQGGKVKIPAAWLIEQAGFRKGYRVGAAGISSKHSLALINRGGASATEILALATKISDAVQERFGIQLEMEPVMLGF